MELNPISLRKADTCLTYVLRRIGLPPDFCSYEELGDKFDQHAFKNRRLKIGDIFVWDNDIEWVWLPWKIDKSGKISNKSVSTRYHLGVYEGDGMFSDATRHIRPPHPSLRLREVKDLKKNPNRVLTLSNEHHNK